MDKKTVKPRNSVNIVQKKVTDAFFAQIELEPQYKTTTVKHIVGVTNKSSSLSAIAKGYNGVSWQDIQKENKMGSSTALKVKQELNVTTKVKIGDKAKFNKITEGFLAQEVFIIIKTIDLASNEFEININQGKDKGVVEKGKAIKVTQNDKETLLIKTKVGELGKSYTNKEDFKDWAIAKIKLAPKENSDIKAYSNIINKITDKKTYLFITVGTSEKVIYADEKGESKKGENPNQWLNKENEYFIFKDQEAKWMLTAKNELGEKEISGKKANKQILEYFKASKFWGTDDSGGENAWCGSFVSWVMKENNYSPPSNAFRAKEWKKFGKTIADPIYGAIGVKSRKGGGHVAFIVGKSKDGKYYYMLGGNQSDEVNITKYNKDVWETFVVPKDYETINKSLPIYSKEAKNEGSES